MFSRLSHARIQHDQRDPVFNEARLHVDTCGDTTVNFSVPMVRVAPLLLYRSRKSPAYGHHKLSARCEEEKMFLRLPGTEPRLLCRSCRSLITILIVSSAIMAFSHDCSFHRRVFERRSVFGIRPFAFKQTLHRL